MESNFLCVSKIRYNSGAKQFSEITSTKHLSAVVDAITIQNSWWLRNPPSHSNAARAAAAANTATSNVPATTVATDSSKSWFWIQLKILVFRLRKKCISPVAFHSILPLTTTKISSSVAFHPDKFIWRFLVSFTFNQPWFGINSFHMFIYEKRYVQKIFDLITPRELDSFSTTCCMYVIVWSRFGVCYNHTMRDSCKWYICWKCFLICQWGLYLFVYSCTWWK